MIRKVKLGYLLTGWVDHEFEVKGEADWSRRTKCKHIQLIEARLMLKLSWDY